MWRNNNRCPRQRRRRGIGSVIILIGLIMVCFALDWSLIAFIGCMLCILGTVAALRL